MAPLPAFLLAPLSSAMAAAPPLLPRTPLCTRRVCESRRRNRTPVIAMSDAPPPITLRDTANIWIDNIMQKYGNRPSRDNVPIANGDIEFIAGDQPFFLGLHSFFLRYGPIFKLCFGPKSFFVIQDPVIVKSILKDNHIVYDKGLLAEVLDEIMGNGLIPADYATWKIRRKAIVPGFHVFWLKYMTGMFATYTQTLCAKLHAINGTAVLDMETEYSSLALDIIGKAVFNFDFNSVNSESPIIKAVYRTLKETEHRSMMLVPYWKIPGAKYVVPRLRAFYSDMTLITDTLETLIQSAKRVATAHDLSELEKRDYENVKDPSLLRFLVELRAEQTSNQQLKDDLVTLLIAGHETIAAVLTWATTELTRNAHVFQRAREEVDSVIGDRHPTYEDVKKLPYLRRVVAETLRLYPAPPLLIRRLLADMVLPRGGTGQETPLRRGTDVFINVYSLHRSPALWDDADTFDPERWLRPTSNPGVRGWSGYVPATGLEKGIPLYPNESNADFAFLPFGGGSRKCVGDQFALLECVVALAMLVRRFDFSFDAASSDVQMTTGATIHTKTGLRMRLFNRSMQRDVGDAGAAAEDVGVQMST